MRWLFEQPPAWLEILIGVTLGLFFLWGEDWIDRYRGRKGNGKRDR
jgi:hypothetical protein